MNIDKRLAAGAGIAGGILLLAWFALTLILAGPRWLNWTTGLAGFALLAVYAWQERNLLKRVALSPQMRHGSNAIIFTVAVVMVIALLNVVASRHSFRVDLTANQFYSLSGQTSKILDNLERKIKVTVFHRTGSAESGRIIDLLDQYKHASNMIDVELVDPDQNPAKATIYKITSVITLVFESGGKRKDVLAQELFGYQYRGRQPQREFKGEPVITAAILSVSKDTQSTVYFLEGHGERVLDDTSETGFAQVKTGLEQDNYVVKTLNLLKEGKVPEDATLIVIAGPRFSIPEPERDLLAAYLAGDGRMLVMLDMETGKSLGPLLKPWGVKILVGMAIDPRSYYFFGGPMVPIPQYRSHKITDDLRKQGIGVLFPGSRALETVETEDATVMPLLETTPESWLEKNWATNTKALPKYNSGTDTSGPLTLAVAVAQSPASAPPTMPGIPPQPPKQIPKLVVFGNVQWITNQIKGNSEANFDLFANAINWLAGSDENISIRPKQVSRRRVNLDNVRNSIMWWTTIVFTPLAVVGVAIFGWWRRRSL